MDPTTLLLSALSLAGAAARPLTDQAVKDSYVGLKTLIVRKFAHVHPRIESTLDDYGDDPETYAKPATKILLAAGVDNDPEVLQRATDLLRLSGSTTDTQNGRTAVHAAGEGSVAIAGNVSATTIMTGDRNSVNRAPCESQHPVSREFVL
jgi:hypothetical protein